MATPQEQALAIRASAARFAAFMEGERRVLAEAGVTAQARGTMEVHEAPLDVFAALECSNVSVHDRDSGSEYAIGYVMNRASVSASAAWVASEGWPRSSADWRQRAGVAPKTDAELCAQATP